ncbi:MAG: hypothetical protein HYS83_01535 [Candidatus Blackburnbacteria bacterium]|nr:hypothetical protein [Candidatus Blackburnbacteria bacterium]
MSPVELPIWFFAKIVFLFAVLVYLFFAAVVVRQVYLMTRTLQVGFETALRIVAWLHLFLVIGVFLLALATL